MSVDRSGNLYAVGSIASTGAYSFGNGVTASGPVYGAWNAVVVKYNSSGIAQWAQSLSAAAVSAIFNDVATDSSGNVYAAGFISGAGTYSFGNNVSVTTATSYPNAVLVKYNASGAAQWAQTTASAPNESQFYAVATDSSGNVYAAGTLYENGTFGFGNGITATGASASNANTILVKYSSSGTAQWARTTTSASSDSTFSAVATDSWGNVYVAGTIDGNAAFGWGNSVTATGTDNSGNNTLLMKYNSSGTAQWAKTTTSASSDSTFSAVAVDSSGNIFAAGAIDGNAAFGWGNSVTATGTFADNVNPVLVMYNSLGTALWARTTASSSSDSSFLAVATDSSGNVYAAGTIDGNAVFGFGNNVTATGAYSSGNNSLLVKYSPSGLAQWARTTTSASNYSIFSGVAADNSGNVYAAGALYGNATVGWSDGVTATGVYLDGENTELVKYQ
jgi:hypothetical protein